MPYTFDPNTANAADLAFSDGRYYLGGEFDIDTAREHFETARNLGHPHAGKVIEWLDVMTSEDSEDLENYCPELNVPDYLMTSGFLQEDPETFDTEEEDLEARRHAEYLWLSFNHDDGAYPNMLRDLFAKLESGYFPREMLNDLALNQSLQQAMYLDIPFAFELNKEIQHIPIEDAELDSSEPSGEDLEKRPPCPRCGGRSVRIYYGLLMGPPAAEGDYKLGGCLVGFGDPNWHCKTCNQDF